MRSVGQTKATKIAISILKVLALLGAYAGSTMLATVNPAIRIPLFCLLVGYGIYLGFKTYKEIRISMLKDEITRIENLPTRHPLTDALKIIMYQKRKGKFWTFKKIVEVLNLSISWR
jgi:hypothetical protein